MQSIELKEFQIETVNKLLDATSVGNKKEVLVQAPTGSGKTIILLSYIEEYLKENRKTIFVWLTPGSGDLEEQSRSKMLKFLPHMESKNIQDVLLQGFEVKDTAFINWETITKKGNTALKEAERKNLYERVREAYNNGYDFVVIVDEEHLNKTVKAEAIIGFIDPKYIVRVSATTKTNKEAEYIEIDELDVINAGLITRALYINENVTNEKVLTNEHDYLLDLAINKRKAIKEEYMSRNIQVNPLIIIQLPNKSDELIKQIEDLLEEKGYSYDRKNLAIWLADRKENVEDIENNESHQAILIMKQEINYSEYFETKVLEEICRLFFEDSLDDINHLPFNIIPKGSDAQVRCCVYKERAILKLRTLAALGYSINDVDRMDGHEFEYFCAELLRKNGYDKAEVTPGSGDQGIDVIAYKDGIKFGVQCKCYTSDIGNKAVQEAYSGKEFYGCHIF